MPTSTREAVVAVSPATYELTGERYHGLDALRGGMMLLGIWLHTVVAYSRHGGWPWKDGSVTSTFDWTLSLIHTFRMPTFYVLAGFFAALLVARRGARAFAKNRALRILVPFVVGWLLMFPLVVCLAVWGLNLGQAHIPAKIGTFFLSGEVLKHLHPMHLWFLEYLMILCAIALGVRWLLSSIPGVMRILDGLFGSILSLRWRVFPLAVLTIGPLCLMGGGGLDDPTGFVPEPKLVLAYLTFFGSGWFIYRHLHHLKRWANLAGALTHLLLGVFAWMTTFAFQDYRRSGEANADLIGFMGCAGAFAFAMWCLIFGLIGLTLRFFNRSIPAVRYLSDSAYWLYLAHMPVLLVFQLALARSNLPAVQRLFIVLVCSLIVLLASYHWLVRPTWVGLVLNGRRYPIGKTSPQPT